MTSAGPAIWAPARNCGAGWSSAKPSCTLWGRPGGDGSPAPDPVRRRRDYSAARSFSAPPRVHCTLDDRSFATARVTRFCGAAYAHARAASMHVWLRAIFDAAKAAVAKAVSDGVRPLAAQRWRRLLATTERCQTSASWHISSKFTAFLASSLVLASVLQDASYELGAIAKRGHCGTSREQLSWATLLTDACNTGVRGNCSAVP